MTETTNATSNVVKNLELLILNANTLKLKDSKSELSKFVGVIIGYKSETIKTALDTAMNARTKKAFKSSVELLNVEITKVITQPVTTEEVEETKTIVLDTDKLAGLADSVRDCIKTSTKAHFQAGSLLSEALDMFKEAGKPAKEWTKWAELHCSVKKAQAYNLVKIHKTFGNNSDYASCSMRTLNILIHLNKDLFKKISEETADLAKNDKLTTKEVNRLVDIIAPKPAPKAPAEPKTPENPLDRAKDKTSETMKQENKNPGQEDLDFQDIKNDGYKPADQSELDKVREENKALKAQLAEMNETLRRMESKVSAKPNTVAPVLPQFSSDCPSTVLGVKLGAGPAEINQTFRSMAKIFNASTCPEGAKALKSARETLLKTTK